MVSVFKTFLIILGQKLLHLLKPEAGIAYLNAQHQLRADELVVKVEGDSGLDVVNEEYSPRAEVWLGGARMLS